MPYSRRKILQQAVLSLAALPVLAHARDVGDATVFQYTGGVIPSQGGVLIEAESFVDDGHAVPITVTAPGAVEIALFAMLNPFPKLVSLRFGPLSASQMLETKIRLGESQDIIAIARMADGGFRQANHPVVVTIGGCG